MIDKPQDTDWVVFYDDIIEPLSIHFTELNWHVTINEEPSVGFWLELT